MKGKVRQMTDENKTTQADVIWNAIKGLQLDLYSLPNQFVEGHVKRLNVAPDTVHLKLNASAVLPALEEAIKNVKVDGQKLGVVQTKQFTIIGIADTDE